jgi:leader peptidase (prepilin peptidase) / N-methyltransferase
MGPVCGVAIALWLAALSVHDAMHARLPNTLTMPGAVVVLAGALLCGRGGAAAAGAVALAGGYLLVHLCSPAGMGAGDVKLAVGVGALTGAFGVEVWTAAAVGAPVLTAVWALTARRRVVPHGPAMCLASALAISARLATMSTS